jgi:formiminotetrahydrofolate cyclodeaminase
MEPAVTTQTVFDFVQGVSQRRHAMAGAVIALSAGQAAALGQACVQISSDEELNPGPQSSESVIERLSQINMELLQWSDRDATAIAEYVALREAGNTLAGQELLCSAPAEVCQIAIEAAKILQDFRPLVLEKVRDDLEIAISLLTGAAQAAMLLLDSNLRIWPDPVLGAQFEPILGELITEIGHLRPVTRIRI